MVKSCASATKFRNLPDMNITSSLGKGCEAISSGIFNDLGSGSNVNVRVITKVSLSHPICAEPCSHLPTSFSLPFCYLISFPCHICYLQGKVECLRNHVFPNPRTYTSTKGYSFFKPTGEVLNFTEFMTFCYSGSFFFGL